ncbi:hypothetical protein PHLCEN_2v11372 [Hermanssonia centrifuga]|uniref:CSC1/OSCA1-like N-terminal transmembrane domain-containing protein n=1 Tax=Hermanssonia centrifuga TaxID=98765 RepID=A0A2R6NK88_9APHY|nr:hypothetical protein PHLCEN_2v11372 [Hermanssonia centrifuga]
MSQVTPEKAEGLDSQTFITALVSNIAVLSVEVIAFVVLKQRLSRIYEPRSYLPPPDKRAIDLPPGPWKWLLATIAIPTGDVLHKNGMDAYMFLRFLRLLIILFASITLLTWLVLLPVDTAGIKDANFSDRLARLSWGNIPDNARGRYAAHIAVVYVSTFWTLFLIRKELIHYTATRQAFLTSRSHASLAQARTVLITSVPEELCDEKELIKWAAFVPGGVQQVWIYRDTTALNQDYKERLAACEKLEGAVSKLIRHIVKAKRKHDSAEEHAKLKKEHADAKARRRGGKKEEGGGGMEYEMQGRVRMDGKGNGNGNAVGRPSTDETVVGDDDGYGERKGSISYEETVHSPTTSASRPYHSRTKTTELEAGNFSPNSPSSSFQPPLSPTAEERSPEHAGGKEVELMMSPEGFMELYAPIKKRPRHRLGTFGLWGKKVDTIDWCKVRNEPVVSRVVY